MSYHKFIQLKCPCCLFFIEYRRFNTNTIHPVCQENLCDMYGTDAGIDENTDGFLSSSTEGWEILDFTSLNKIMLHQQPYLGGKSV